MTSPLPIPNQCAGGIARRPHRGGDPRGVEVPHADLGTGQRDRAARVACAVVDDATQCDESYLALSVIDREASFAYLVQLAQQCPASADRPARERRQRFAWIALEDRSIVQGRK